MEVYWVGYYLVLLIKKNNMKRALNDFKTNDLESLLIPCILNIKNIKYRHETP